MSTPDLRLHAPSLFLGCAVVLALGLNRPAPIAAGPAVQTARHVLASGTGDWRDIVRIEEGYPFQVPEDRALVLQSAGYTGSPSFNFAPPVAIDIDGEVELLLDPTSGANRVVPGWVVDSGSRVTVRLEGDDLVGYAFGYLVSL